MGGNFYQAEMSCLATKNSSLVIVVEILGLFIIKGVLVCLDRGSKEEKSFKKISRKFTKKEIIGDQNQAGEATEDPKNTQYDQRRSGVCSKLISTLNQKISSKLITVVILASSITLATNSTTSLRHISRKGPQNTPNTINSLFSGFTLLAYIGFTMTLYLAQTPCCEVDKSTGKGEESNEVDRPSRTTSKRLKQIKELIEGPGAGDTNKHNNSGKRDTRVSKSPKNSIFDRNTNFWFFGEKWLKEFKWQSKAALFVANQLLFGLLMSGRMVYMAGRSLLSSELIVSAGLIFRLILLGIERPYCKGIYYALFVAVYAIFVVFLLFLWVCGLQENLRQKTKYQVYGLIGMVLMAILAFISMIMAAALTIGSINCKKLKNSKKEKIDKNEGKTGRFEDHQGREPFRGVNDAKIDEGMIKEFKFGDFEEEAKETIFNASQSRIPLKASSRLYVRHSTTKITQKYELEKLENQKNRKIEKGQKVKIIEKEDPEELPLEQKTASLRFLALNNA